MCLLLWWWGAIINDCEKLYKNHDVRCFYAALNTTESVVPSPPITLIEYQIDTRRHYYGIQSNKGNAGNVKVDPGLKVYIIDVEVAKTIYHNKL